MREEKKDSIFDDTFLGALKKHNEIEDKVNAGMFVFFLSAAGYLVTCVIYIVLSMFGVVGDD